MTQDGWRPMTPISIPLSAEQARSVARQLDALAELIDAEQAALS